eukprot:1157777-Pelagomonas_calceolata.AAC.9
MRLQYQGTQPAVLHDAQLAPQDGCAVVSAAAPGLLPACVHPGTYLNLSFVLSTGVQYIAGSSNVQKGTVAPSSSAAAAAAADADAAVPVVNGKGVDCEGDDDEGSAAAALAMARHYGAQESKLILVYGVTTDAPHTSRCVTQDVFYLPLLVAMGKMVANMSFKPFAVEMRLDLWHGLDKSEAVAPGDHRGDA